MYPDQVRHVRSRPARVGAVALCVVLLAGCGFHLRGATTVASIPAVYLAGGGGDFSRTVRSRLEQGGATLVPTADAAGLRVMLSPERRSRRGVGTSANASIAEYEMRLEVDLTVLAGDTTLIDDELLASERVYRLDEASLVGSDREEAILWTEMREELARKVLYRLDAAGRMRAPAAGSPGASSTATDGIAR